MIKVAMFFILCLLTHVTLVQGSSISNLRGLEKHIEHCSECTLKIIDGMTENPGEDDGIENYICESTCAGEIDSHFYSFKGDAKSFFSDILENGTIKVNVPEYARYDDSAIDLESLSIEDVTVDERRRLGNSGMRKGYKKILVVLVKDQYGNKPSQSRQEMSNAIFGGDGNGLNMRERFKSCSGGQLEYDKAIGSGVYNGVVEVTINQNINNMHYKDASNLASATGVFSDVKRDHIMYILPDNADFTGSFIAWGVFDGYTTWFKSRVASFPFVQSHELGHNLGHSHSGGDGRNYGDATCMMGNEAPHDTQGTKMCFNPAKTWYNGWFENHQSEVFAQNNFYDGDLVGVDDATNNRYRGGMNQDAVVKVNSDHSSNVNDLFLMFNSKNGINSEVVGSGNRVVITEQVNDYRQSWHVGSLGYKEVHREKNWKNGKDLIIKNCGSDSNNDSVRVLVYLEGKDSLSCDDGQYNNNSSNNSSNNNNASGQVMKFKTNSKCIANANGNLRTVKCQNQKSQKWIMDSDGFIRSKANSNKCIQKDGNNLKVGGCFDNSRFDYTSNDELQWKNNSNKCISRDSSGNNLILKSCNSATTWQRVFL